MQEGISWRYHGLCPWGSIPELTVSDHGYVDKGLSVLTLEKTDGIRAKTAAVCDMSLTNCQQYVDLQLQYSVVKLLHNSCRIRADSRSG